MPNSDMDTLHTLTQIAQPDHHRQQRTGMPEIVLADRKSIDQNIAIATTMLKREHRVILSRVSPDLLAALTSHFGDLVETGSTGTTVVLRATHQTVPQTGGCVGILTAGTSDIPAAEEAGILCRELGCAVQTAYDVGVAGLHRLQAPLQAMLVDSPVDVLIVAAGMDGALPSVVAGLGDAPVIGLPTSVGYGFGGDGVAALMSMLQSCAPGLAVVNIDNGIGAGAMAARIANRAAEERKRTDK